MVLALGRTRNKMPQSELASGQVFLTFPGGGSKLSTFDDDDELFTTLLIKI